jgi:hypothetical protein
MKAIAVVVAVFIVLGVLALIDLLTVVERRTELIPIN